MAALEGALRLPPTVCSVLVARGVTEPDEAKTFLRPLIDHLHDADALADGAAASARIAEAVARDETILVHGDYDVDGICAAALLTRYLRELGARVTPFVPHRVRDGYDFGAAGLEAAEAAGASLIVTADCGSVAVNAVADARAAGIDVVLTDHHTVGPELPDAVAVVNPQRPDCPYPFKGLCGTAVAFKVAELVGRRLGADADLLMTYLDLVALATVADLVPLRGENRVLVHFGLRRFARSRLPGVRALFAEAGVEADAVTAGQLGFVIAPRINAAGRIGESDDALRLLLSDADDEAGRLARRLGEINRERQDEDRRTLDEALRLLEGTYDPERDYGVLLSADGWHPGVIGIVASRIVERIHRPTVLVALDGDDGRGSARSIPGFHLYEALAACAPHMGRFGGHRQAAGMDVRREDVESLREAFNAEARRRLTPDDLRPTLKPDAELALGDADLGLVHWLDYLGPHGMGNPRPTFLVRDARVTGARIVGERHLKVTLHGGETTLDAIGFGLAERLPPETLRDEPYDALVKLERNEWRGVAKVQAQIVDLRPAGEAFQ